MIVFIAPYSAAKRASNQNLGAMRKVEFFLTMASHLAGDVLLVNTQHEDEKWAGREVRESRIGDVRVREIALRSYPIRTIGKMLNLFEVEAVSREILNFGNPEMVWIYNSYAFEAMLARVLTRKSGARLVFQFEDWPFSRRYWHPKPLVDFLVWRYFLPAPSVCLAVNDNLSTREHERSGCPVVLCPGVVSEDLRVACRRRRPFEGPEGRRTVIGYFGGLWPEKGADLVLEIMRRSNGRFILHVCGAGPLSSEFEKLSAASEAVRFHGRVDETTLFNLVSDCDVLINVHSSIEKMGDGIFPFKVVEYVASGRLVISTELPALSMREIHDAVHFVAPDAESILDALSGAESLYRSKHREIEKAMAVTQEALSEGGLEQTISMLLNEPRVSSSAMAGAG
ncbi:glycosyltransferase [Paraburkholderia sp. RL18-103-BIB-C]|jgi:glycosyltransferase involved in cell wall biosynthesis|uniref:glycosyltransferase n=1 Tax=unclassified Paraburkholderia TaxID=2615204 RepID=UPI0038B9A6AE